MTHRASIDVWQSMNQINQRVGCFSLFLLTMPFSSFMTCVCVHDDFNLSNCFISSCNLMMFGPRNKRWLTKSGTGTGWTPARETHASKLQPTKWKVLTNCVGKTHVLRKWALKRWWHTLAWSRQCVTDYTAFNIDSNSVLQYYLTCSPPFFSSLHKWVSTFVSHVSVLGARMYIRWIYCTARTMTDAQ